MRERKNTNYHSLLGPGEDVWCKTGAQISWHFLFKRRYMYSALKYPEITIAGLHCEDIGNSLSFMGSLTRFSISLIYFHATAYFTKELIKMRLSDDDLCFILKKHNVLCKNFNCNYLKKKKNCKIKNKNNLVSKITKILKYLGEKKCKKIYKSWKYSQLLGIFYKIKIKTETLEEIHQVHNVYDIYLHMFRSLYGWRIITIILHGTKS